MPDPQDAPTGPTPGPVQTTEAELPMTATRFTF